MKIKEYIAKTTKECIQRIYIQGAQLFYTHFNHIGESFSYEIDYENKRVIILPTPTGGADGKGTISKKRSKEQVIPVLDISNKKIASVFEGCKKCKITILEDEIIVDGLFEELEEQQLENAIAVLEAHGVTNIDQHTSFCLHKNTFSFYQSDDHLLSLKEIAVSGGSINKEHEPFVVRLLSLFSGVGAFEEALNGLGIPFELVNYCEKESYIAEAYSLIHQVPLDKNLGNIREVDEKQLDDFDLMTYGFPCQDISALGNQKGLFDEDGTLTRSGLFFEAMRIAAYKQPLFMIGENVRDLLYQKFETEFTCMIDLLKELSYNSYYKVLNAKDFNLPHSRNRIFIVSIHKEIDTQTFTFPDKQPLKLTTKHLRDYCVRDRDLYMASDEAFYYNEQRLKKLHSSLDSKNLICMTTKQGGRRNPQNFFRDIYGVRIMTANELFRFQGFNKKYGDLLLNHGFSLKQIGYMLGNSIAVPVLKALFKQLFDAYLPEPL